MNTSPKFPADIRSPLETLRNLMDKAEMLARHIADGAPDLTITNHMQDFIDKLPFDELSEAEQAQERWQEERDDKAYHDERKAMYRPQRV